jgi:hypothetical protein
LDGKPLELKLAMNPEVGKNNILTNSKQVTYIIKFLSHAVFLQSTSDPGRQRIYSLGEYILIPRKEISVC